MYAQFFGLKQEPFSIAPDPRYLFMSERHREALAHLLYGVNGGGGFVLLSGEIGAGKTTVCRCFLEKIPKHCNVAYIFNPKLTAIELLKSACAEFGIRLNISNRLPTVSDYLGAINKFLLRTHAVRQNNVLIIDEAQNLSIDVLEQLRLLTNLETSERKLLQIILIGQPELRDLLARPELEQLAQRIIARFHLEALTQDETSRYIRHRMMVAGMKKALPFDLRARRRVHELTRGIPRRINLLCDRALLGAYASGQARVDRRLVNQAAKEVFYRPKHWGWDRASLVLWLRRYWVAVILILMGLLLVGVGLSGLVKEVVRPSPFAAATESRRGEVVSQPVAEVVNAAKLAPPPPLTQVQNVATGFDLPARKQVAKPLLAQDFGAKFATVLRTENDALRELASLWKVTLGDADPCLEAAMGHLLCYRENATLALIRELDRPVIMALKDEVHRPVYALLVGLGPESAKLRMGGHTENVSLISLAALWRGELATFWRSPVGFTSKLSEGQSSPMIKQVATQLARYFGEPPPSSKAVFDNILRSKLSTFQMASGLKPDGIPGPTTFMQLNRVSGVDEPRLERLAASIP